MELLIRVAMPDLGFSSRYSVVVADAHPQLATANSLRADTIALGQE
jgi:hypothetical protein